MKDRACRALLAIIRSFEFFPKPSWFYCKNRTVHCPRGFGFYSEASVEFGPQGTRPDLRFRRIPLTAAGNADGGGQSVRQSDPEEASLAAQRTAGPGPVREERCNEHQWDSDSDQL